MSGEWRYRVSVRLLHLPLYLHKRRHYRVPLRVDQWWRYREPARLYVIMDNRWKYRVPVGLYVIKNNLGRLMFPDSHPHLKKE